MKSSFLFFTLFCLILWFGNTINARKDISGYWRGVMKDQPMPEATPGLVSNDLTSNEKISFHGTTEEKIMKKYAVKDFVPAVENKFWIYDDFTKPTSKQNFFSEEFEPRPSGLLSGKKSFAREFEPGPNVSVYDDEASV